MLGREAAEHLGGGCDLVGFHSEPPLIAPIARERSSFGMAHLPFCGTKPSQTADAADVRPDTCKTPSWARSVHTVVGWFRAMAMMFRRRTEAGMALSGRGGFRSDTRTMRMERLHGPKGARSGPRVLSPEEREKLRQEALEERERYRRERVSRETPCG